MSHPNILSVLAHGRGQTVVRYAPFTWGRRSSDAQRAIASWGLQLVSAYDTVLQQVPTELRGQFVRPVWQIDVGGHIRLAFPPASREHLLEHTAPEQHRSWPRCNESALVFAIGKLLAQMSQVDDVTIAMIIDRARAESRRRRFKTLAELRAALTPFGSRQPLRHGDELAAWTLFEDGAGWLALGAARKALGCFEAARTLDESQLFADGIDEARRELDMGPDPQHAPPPRHVRRVEEEPAPVIEPRRWAEVEAEARRLERERAFSQALDLYQRVTEVGAPLYVARARCHLHLGDTGRAIDFAQRAVVLDQTIVLAHDILVTAQLSRQMVAEAFRSAEQFVTVHPTCARAHYLLGRALFARGRVGDARAAFEHALKLDPQLLEAQLLRGEVERAVGNLRQSVGAQHAPTFDVPEQLAELRDVLVSGNTHAALAALRDERYARDADAQLLLARFLAFDGQHEAAIAVYDALEATSHRTAALVGKATALLELGRAGDALSIFEQLPNDTDAAEGQARALEQLGRLDDAAEAYRRFIALASSGSALRVRAAQLALDDLARRRRR